MSFGWINWFNAAAVAFLIITNIIAAAKGIAGSFDSRHRLVNILEQVGRYGCMALMILPIFAEGWKFGFGSDTECFIWIGSTILLLVIYTILWLVKPKSGAGVLCGLAIVPVVLFLINGVLLRHIALIVFSLLFGVCHLLIVKENIPVEDK